MTEKTRYSDEELQEFKELILAKLEKASLEYDRLRDNLTNLEGNDIADTSPTFKVLEEGANTLNKEAAGQLAQRQMKFIQNLQAALVRIENKTYGVCRKTGKLIPKELKRHARALTRASRWEEEAILFRPGYSGQAGV